VVCKNKSEAARIALGLTEVDVMAFVAIVGVLTPLGDMARRRTMTFVSDNCEEMALETQS
jgi:hypothetical protein